jgi:hypothetical protein
MFSCVHLTKTCPRCGEELPSSAFYKSGERLSPYCRPCTSEYNRERRDVGFVPTRVRGVRKPTPPGYNTRQAWLQRLRKLGVTEEDYFAMLEAQGGRCAICPTDQPWSRSDTWAVDHDHETGAVRALLCHRCNTALGLLGDDPARMRAAADYVERHKSSPIAAAFNTM